MNLLFTSSNIMQLINASCYSALETAIFIIFAPFRGGAAAQQAFIDAEFIHKL